MPAWIRRSRRIRREPVAELEWEVRWAELAVGPAKDFPDPGRPSFEFDIRSPHRVNEAGEEERVGAARREARYASRGRNDPRLAEPGQELGIVLPARVAEMHQPRGIQPKGDERGTVVAELADEKLPVAGDPMPMGMELNVHDSGIERTDFTGAHEAQHSIAQQLLPVLAHGPGQLPQEGVLPDPVPALLGRATIEHLLGGHSVRSGSQPELDPRRRERRSSDPILDTAPEQIRRHHWKNRTRMQHVPGGGVQRHRRPVARKDGIGNPVEIVEAVVDRVGDEPHRLSGRAKDLGSAAVFMSLALVVVVWGLIAWSRFGPSLSNP